MVKVLYLFLVSDPLVDGSTVSSRRHRIVLKLTCSSGSWVFLIFIWWSMSEVKAETEEWSCLPCRDSCEKSCLLNNLSMKLSYTDSLLSEKIKLHQKWLIAYTSCDSKLLYTDSLPSEKRKKIYHLWLIAYTSCDLKLLYTDSPLSEKRKENTSL